MPLLRASPFLLAVLLTGVPIARAELSLGVDLGIGSVTATGQDVTVVSSLLDASIGTSEHSRIIGHFGLTKLSGSADGAVRPSNVAIEALYFGNNADNHIGVALAFGFAAVAQGRLENMGAAATRGYWDVWLWLPQTTAFVSTFGVGWTIGNTVSSYSTLDIATLFPTGASDRDTTVAWQFGHGYRIPIVREYLILNLMAGLVRPTERFLGAANGGFELFVEPSLDLHIGWLAVRGGANISLSGPRPSAFDDEGGVYGHIGVGIF